MKEIVGAITERPVISYKKNHVLVGVPGGREREDLVRCIGDACSIQEMEPASTFTELEARAAFDPPGVIVFSEKILPNGTSLAEATHRLTAFAPVVVIASSERQSELVGFMVSGEVDFVTISGEFGSVAAAFVERRLSSSEGYSREFRSAWTADVPSDFAEILRHEINNPLTGILGNAELLLSQLRGKLPAMSVQRLETVVDLAVRLRERVRRLASEPRTQGSRARSA
jgi:signal transduction histidine kinase